jgi:hypothetical protein
MKRIQNTSSGRPIANNDLLAIQDQLDVLAAQYLDYAPIVIAGGQLIAGVVQAAKVLIVDGGVAAIASVPAITTGLTSSSGVAFTISNTNVRAYGGGTNTSALREAVGNFVSAQGGATIFLKCGLNGYERYWKDVPVDPVGSVKMVGLSISGIEASGFMAESSIWKGWAVCDGRNGTPDLKSRFPLGYEAFVTTVQDTGGADNFTIGVTNLPAHSHGIEPNPHTHVNGAFNQLLRVTGGGTTSTVGDSTAGEPDLTAAGTMASTTLTISETGGGNAISFVPKHTVLLFLMRVR